MTNIKIVIMYDFDGTIAPGNMQEHNFIPEIGSTPKKFWKEVSNISKKQNADNILVYMDLMLRKAKDKRIALNKQKFKDLGKEILLYKGVKKWFDRIKQYAKEKNIAIKHYIISAGNKEIIEGTKIKKHFEEIYGCSYLYDENDVPYAPGVAINYTNKTQFIFRINKGCKEIYDNKKINAYIPK